MSGPAAPSPGGRRQRPARRLLRAADPQAADLGLLAAFAIAAGVAGLALVNPPGRPGRVRRGPRRRAARRLRDRRLARRRHLLRPYAAAQADDLSRRPRHAAAGRRRCCAKATTATPTATPRGPARRRRRGHPRPLHLRGRAPDSEGNQETNYYRYTVGLAEVPECRRLAPELYCQRKFGLRALEGLEDVFRSKERVELESEALDERYEIFANPSQDSTGCASSSPPPSSSG